MYVKLHSAKFNKYKPCYYSCYYYSQGGGGINSLSSVSLSFTWKVKIKSFSVLLSGSKNTFCNSLVKSTNHNKQVMVNETTVAPYIS